VLPVTPLDPSAAPRPPRRGSAWEIGLIQGGYLLFCLPWFLLAIGGTMSLANWDSLLAPLIILAWWVYPVVVVASAVTAWALYASRLVRAARWVNLVPVPWVVTGVVMLTWIFLAG
jgi:hypothetical protein